MKMRVLTTSDWKLVAYAGETYGELYDRRSDPDEMINRWSDPACAAIRAKLQAMLFEEVMCSLDVINGRRQSPSPPQSVKWIPKHNQQLPSSREEE
jgi:hypothetical protein